MDSAIGKQLIDKIYEKRKAAALELEKQIRECHQQGDQRRISQIIDQLVEMFKDTSFPLHVRNGGLIGLAGTAIALGMDISPYMDKFVHALLDCFVDPENRIRYFSAECLYNIAKVSKGEVLVYFNDIFDALSKLAADSELSVKNGAELLDRLLKDIVAESASVYIPLYPETEKVRDQREPLPGVLVPYPDGSSSGEDYPGSRKAFSLAHFIPQLRERIYVVSPFTRSYLVSWINVLDSVPELELISYLPDFLDGLLKYLSDPTEDVRVATEGLLADFLREIREVNAVRKITDERAKSKRESEPAESIRRNQQKLPDLNLEDSERALFISENNANSSDDDVYSAHHDDTATSDIIDYRDSGAWIPGQGVRIDYAAIVEILLQQVEGEDNLIQQSTALRWLAEFLNFAAEVMVPFTPRLIPAVLPKLAHHAAMIQSAAIRTNKLLLNVIQTLPSPVEGPTRPASTDKQNNNRVPASPTPTPSASTAPSRQSTTGKDGTRDVSSPESMNEGQTPTQSTAGSSPALIRTRANANASTSGGSAPDLTPRVMNTDMGPPPVPMANQSRPHSPMSFTSQSGVSSTAPTAGGISQPLQPLAEEEADLFDYQETVNGLTVQFLSEFEETRVAALKWLIMLHQKAPKKILAMDDGTFPALLKTLSDSSEEVIKHDLQLLAQISSSSEENYFKAFMMNLLELFSTDRRLLETRGSLIIRQLCVNLNTERIYRTFAEILEKEDDLEFAGVIVQKLNIILITSPELADFRKRLKSLETRQDGQALFTTLYRSWCHNAVAAFSLCLLAQAYEHASNLLYIFADLEITVHMLVQVDKLVQLIESPVFTYLRLQLLEPERYPYLFKCLYGLLMLLPQSLAFVSLRNRLNAVNSAGFLHIAPKSAMGPLSNRSKIGRDEIKWQELLLHFRSTQTKHEKARRQAMGADTTSYFFSDDESTTVGSNAGSSRGPPNGAGTGTGTARPAMRRKMTGPDLPLNVGTPGMSASRSGVLSPLNPRARGQSGPPSSSLSTNALGVERAPTPMSPPPNGSAPGKRRMISLGRKT